MQQKMDSKAINIKIEGGHKLHGTVVTKTSKNGAMGLLAASLLNRGKTTLRNVPRIEEVFRMIEVFQSIGISVKWTGVNNENGLGTDLEIIPPEHFAMENMDVAAAEKTRSVIMLIGPLIHSLKKFSLPQAGGCKLGPRTSSTRSP
jgi:UDP-N-acetylglucosamine 1-carboxyvinyltransferase